ncbi:MAG: calcium/sodium antiporter [Gammaproteobacteria bacterium]|jgi:cation:H+ antiporter|nr:calcium/sodium antiporter [Gammaproteobacteria bacterium]
MLINCLFVLAGLTLLVVGADRFVVGAANIARLLDISPLIIGLTVVGVATSAPEVLVGTVAALDGKTTLAIGNAVGSNIANIGLVLGATALACPLVVLSPTLRREFLLMFASILVATCLLLDSYLSRMDGLILISCLVLSMWWIIRLARSSSKADPLAGEFEQELAQDKTDSVAKSTFLLIFGLLLLLGGAELLVRGAIAIAQEFGVSDLVIGLTIVAIGTSLPELAASITSVIKNEADIAVGNVIGSNMFNMLMVLGIPILIHPTEVSTDVIYRDIPIMITLTLLMGWMVFVYGRGKFDRIEGGFLFLCFIAYQYWLFSTISA